MCGITGLYGFQNQPAERGLLEKMNQEIVHRGPDADGFYTHGHVGLAMRRLKVIDLESGNQPIANEDQTLWIVFNGEIYNYRELREDLVRKGHKFHTHSDTEVIVHLYQDLGEKCVEKLFGMFAFAIYDTKNDSLFIARDRLGIKPLFYHQSEKGVVFGSEIKPILKSGWLSPQINLQAVNHFLSLNYLPQPWTPFEGITQLPPGHWMKIMKNRVDLREYWDIPAGETIEISEEESCKKILELLHRSMKRRLIADVPIGTYLSGGLDSSALVWLMKEHRHGTIKTFSVGFDHPAYDETPYAREVAQHFGTDHYEIKCGPQDVMETIPKIAWHADNLLADQAALPLYLVSKLAKKHVTVCLSGDGGDEVFVGYPTFHADRYHRIFSKIPAVIRRGLVQPLVNSLPASAEKLSFDYKAKKFIEAGDYNSEKAHYWWRTIYNDREKEALFTSEARARLGARGLDSYSLYGNYFQKASARGAEFVNRCLYADMKVWLAGNNLYKVDTMSMAHGLEARVPFLDHELVEFMAKLPPELKFKGNVLKYLMKKVLKGKLPERVYARKKAGFHSPISFWFRNALQDSLKQTFAEPLPKFQQILRKEKIGDMLDQHFQGKQNHAYRIWGLLIFRSWIKNFMSAS